MYKKQENLISEVLLFFCGFSVFICLSSVNYLSWWDKVKGANQGQGGGVFEGCSHGFSVFFCLSSVDYLSCRDKTKGANQG